MEAHQRCTAAGRRFGCELPTAQARVRTCAPPAADWLVLGDGTRIGLRLLGPCDGDRLAALIARLSAESRYRRYLSPKPRLSPRELAYLTDIDHACHEAFAAIDQRDGSIVGVGRYVHHRDRPNAAEVAFEVADELQRNGIGTALARRVVEHARARGVALLTATTLWENRAARALLRRLEFRARTSHGAEIELELELDSARDQFGRPRAGAGSDGDRSALKRSRAESGAQPSAPTGFPMITQLPHPTSNRRSR